MKLFDLIRALFCSRKTESSVSRRNDQHDMSASPQKAGVVSAAQSAKAAAKAKTAASVSNGKKKVSL